MKLGTKRRASAGTFEYRTINRTPKSVIGALFSKAKAKPSVSRIEETCDPAAISSEKPRVGTDGEPTCEQTSADTELARKPRRGTPTVNVLVVVLISPGASNASRAVIFAGAWVASPRRLVTR